MTEQKSMGMMDNLKDKVSELRSNITETVKDKSQVLKEKAMNAESVASTYVKENPWKAVGIGVAAGIVLAQLLRLRK